MKDWHTITAEKNEREIHNILNNIMLDNKLSQKRKNKLLSKKQMVVAKNFNGHMINSGFKSSTRKFYLQTLRNFLCFTKKDEMRKIGRKDIENFLLSLKMVQSSKYTVQLFLRCFFKWVYKSKEGELPKVVEWIKPKKSRNGTKLPEEMLELDEIKQMAQVATNFRDKAIIRVLHESATRASEFLGLKIKHCTLDKYGAVIMVDGKTGMRRIRLINSVPALIKWLNAHPDSKNPEAPLWVNLKAWQGKAFGQSGLKLLLNVLGSRAGIKKKIFPHLFRHSRMTELAKDLTEQELKIFAGWESGSTMPRIYIHLSGKDVDDKLLAIAGKKDIVEADADKKKKEALKPKVCPRCEKISSAESKFCDVCGMALDLKTVMFLDEKKDSMDDRMIGAFKNMKKKEEGAYNILMKFLSKELYDKEVIKNEKKNS